MPARDEPRQLTAARTGEGNRSWSAGAGCGALATGLVEVLWLLRRIRGGAPEGTTAFLDWSAFAASTGSLFLWEAFVSGEAKGEGHAHDVEIAVGRFIAALPDPTSANALHEPDVLSLAGACLLRAGWSTDVRMLGHPCLVLRA